VTPAPLAALQRHFHALATGAAPLEGAAALVAGTPALDAAARAGIYAGMYRARLEEALLADFPAVAAVLGSARFHALSHAYLEAHPSDEPDIGRFGRHLPAFLAAHPDPARPDLADLAALEWARAEVLTEADAPAAGRDALAALADPQAFALARPVLVPALRLLRLAHDAPAVWRAHEQGAPLPAPSPSPTDVAVWRVGFDVVHGELSAAEARALAAATQGAPLVEVLAAFEGEGGAEAGLAALLGWIDEGWLEALGA